MKIRIHETAHALALDAAADGAERIRQAIRDRGAARIMLSTGASQFALLAALVAQEIDWSKVEMFHLDEYVGLPRSHPASFRRYLEERFLAKLPHGALLKAVHFVSWEGNVDANIAALSREILREPVDVGFIGIGENAHIAFNDPPADFSTHEPYIVVTLDERCRLQQVGEGWYPDVASVPERAVTASVHQIMQCRSILCCVPFAVKADAVKRTLETPLSPLVPATILKTHEDATILLDRDSAAGTPVDVLARFDVTDLRAGA